MGAAASMSMGPLSLAAAARVFGAGVMVGMSLNNALNVVSTATQAVIDYLRNLSCVIKRTFAMAYEGLKTATSAAYEHAKSTAAWAYGKVKEAAKAVKLAVVDLIDRLFGSKKAAQAEREMDSTLALAAPSSSATIVPADTAPQMLAMVKSVSPAASTKRMMALVNAVVFGDGQAASIIPAEAKSFIAEIAAAVAMCLEALPSHQ